jgi:hypothetical protein
MHGSKRDAPTGKQPVNGEKSLNLYIERKHSIRLNGLKAVFDKNYAKWPVIRCWTWHAKPVERKQRRP